MDIIYLGHSSFKITGKTASVVTDPFEQTMVGIKFPKEAADIITISHDHADHNYLDWPHSAKVINGPGEYEIKGISVLGYPSFHDNENGAKRGKNTMYVIEVDGYRLLHLGDLGHLLSEKDITLVSNIDILFVPVGGEYTVGPHEAAQITKEIEPSIVIPMHFGDTSLNQEAFGSLKSVNEFNSTLGLTPEKTSKLTLKIGASLPEEMKLYELSRK